MENGLSIELACPFEPIVASCAVLDPICHRSVPLSGAYGLFFVSRGVLRIRTRTRQIELSGGEALLLRGSTAEQVSLTAEAEAEYYHLRFRLTSRGSSAGTPLLEVPDRARVCPPERLTDLLRRYLELERRPNYSRLSLYNLLVLILCELARSAAPRAGDQNAEPTLEIIASRVDACIAAHYRRAIGTLDIARELHYNPDYLERAYRQERGISIREAIHRRRIREARAQLLLCGDSRIAEIAALCGYNDTSYFRRVFKRVTSMTPNRFRAEATVRS